MINLYSGTEVEPTTVVRLDQARKDYETKGFFRIGILPIGIMEGVTFGLGQGLLGDWNCAKSASSYPGR